MKKNIPLRIATLICTTVLCLIWTQPALAYKKLDERWLPKRNHFYFQQHVLRGQVINEETGLPAPFVTVMQPDGHRGVKADQNGRFRLPIYGAGLVNGGSAEVYVASNYWTTPTQTFSESDLWQQTLGIYKDYQTCKSSANKYAYKACMFNSHTGEVTFYVKPNGTYANPVEVARLTSKYRFTGNSKDYTLRVKIIDEATGNPVSNVVVNRAYSATWDKTDADGYAYLNARNDVNIIYLPCAGLDFCDNGATFTVDQTYYRTYGMYGYVNTLTIPIHIVNAAE